MNLKSLYDNTYVRIAVLTPVLCYAGTQAAKIPPPDFGMTEKIQCFCDDYKLSDAQAVALGLIGVTVLWGGVGLYNENRKQKDLEQRLGEDNENRNQEINKDSTNTYKVE